MYFTMKMSHLLLIAFVLCISISSIAGYSVSGNQLYDPSGAKATLRGMCRPSFEWNAVGEQASLADYTLMKTGWGANIVRLSLNQDFWLAGSSYAATIDQQVSWITGLGMGVILDLHWNQGGQQNMADRNSITFWSQVAAHYKDNNAVMFELYNEPHDVSWSQWLNGDSSYAGMQEMYNAVRAAGADNVVIVGGLNWAFDLSGVISGTYQVQGSNIAYATHPYDYAGKQIGDWPAAFGSLAASFPVIMTEFGQYCATNTYVADLLNYAENLGIHYTAWAWYVSGCQFPSIISDWAGTPFSGVGTTVKSYIGRNSASSVLPHVTPVSPSSSSPSSLATSAPINVVPSSSPSSPSSSSPSSEGCDIENVRLVQNAAGSFNSNGKQVSQYNVGISHSCSGKRLTQMSFSATNWNSVINSWNVEVSSGSSLSLPSYTSIPDSSLFGIGYQTSGDQASFTITSVTFQ